MREDRSTHGRRDELFEGFPDWDGPTHARPLAPRAAASSAWRPWECCHWRQPVQLLGGITVFASAWLDRPARHPVDLNWPDVGFYLDGSWAQATMFCSPGFRPPFARHRRSKTVLYPWPDRGVPNDAAQLRQALRWLLRQAAEGRRIEIGCAGGHGRTGTALAALMVLQGASVHDAVRLVRRTYCEDAIETRAQVELLPSLDGR